MGERANNNQYPSHSSDFPAPPDFSQLHISGRLLLLLTRLFWSCFINSIDYDMHMAYEECHKEHFYLLRFVVVYCISYCILLFIIMYLYYSAYYYHVVVFIVSQLLLLVCDCLIFYCLLSVIE